MTRGRDPETVLRELAAPALWPGRELRAVEGARKAYRAGRWLCFICQIHFADLASDEPPAQALVTFGDGKALSRAFARAYGKSTEGRAWFSLADDCLVEVFPNDFALLSLASAFDVSAMRRLLSEATGVGSVTNLAIRPLRYRPHKHCLVAYALEGTDGSHDYFGKLYGSEDTAAQAWSILTALQASDAVSALVPQPVLYRPEWGLTVMSRVPGRRLSHTIERTPGSEAAREGIAATAALLASLHTVSIESEETRTLASDLERVRARNGDLPAGAATYASRLEAVTGGLTVNEPVEAPRCFVHGDFNPRQILLEGSRVGAVDFDGACRGEPAVDVGRFMASLTAKAVEEGEPAFDALASVFINSYEAHAAASVRQAAGVGQIIGLVYRAQRLLERSGGEAGATDTSKVEKLVERAEKLSAESVRG